MFMSVIIRWNVRFLWKSANGIEYWWRNVIYARVLVEISLFMENFEIEVLGEKLICTKSWMKSFFTRYQIKQEFIEDDLWILNKWEVQPLFDDYFWRRECFLFKMTRKKCVQKEGKRYSFLLYRVSKYNGGVRKDNVFEAGYTLWGE